MTVEDSMDVVSNPQTKESKNSVENRRMTELVKDFHGDYVVDVKNLNFSYNIGGGKEKHVLKDLTLQLPRGSRCLLIGANGAGKSTLLRILAGRHLVKPDEACMMLGMNTFRDTKLNFIRAYMDTEWALRTVAFAGYGVPLQADIPVSGMMTKLQSEYPERRDELLDLLGVDPEWRMHRVSDGQRRRVQLFLGLIRPFEVLLMDEITTCLDVVVRQDLLRWLEKETKTRGCTVLYATHIFDGLDEWPTHFHYLTDKGSTGWQGSLQELDYYRDLRAQGHPSPLLKIAERWLRAELEEKKRLKIKEKEAGEVANNEENDLLKSTKSGGGYVSGRLYEYHQKKPAI